MSRPETTESVLSVRQRPPAQRNLPGAMADGPSEANLREAGPGEPLDLDRTGFGDSDLDPVEGEPDDRGFAPSDRTTSDRTTSALTIDELAIDALDLDDPDPHERDLHERERHERDLRERGVNGLDLTQLGLHRLDLDQLAFRQLANARLPIDDDLHIDDDPPIDDELGIDPDRSGRDVGTGSDLTRNQPTSQHHPTGDRPATGTSSGRNLTSEDQIGGDRSSDGSAPASSTANDSTPTQTQATASGSTAAGADTAETGHRVDPRLVALAEMNAADPRHGTLRRTVIEAHLPLVHHLAQRFRGRGEPYDDLVQVGTIGLLHAVDRYDPGRGSFAAFAVPTIVGEIRRHFRDRGWALRIPRRVQDLGRRVSEARETLTHGLDRSPTVGELASYLQVDSDLVLEALETASAYITVPLPITADESDRMARAFEDSGLELVEQRETLRPLLAQLPARQQRILELRFFRGMSQSQIASEIGVSQMHVSRLLAKSLSALRSELTEEL